MPTWGWALLLKPLAAVGVAFVYYVVVYKGSRFIGRFITNKRLRDFLFRERGRHDAGRSASTRDKPGSSADDFRSLPRGD